MTLETKIEDAKIFIEKIMKECKKPIVMSSFGKDSMVLLHLFKSLGIKLPILQHREPWADPHVYEFADQIISSEGYEMFDYLPSGTSITKNEDKTEITSYYQIGDNKFVWLGKNIEKPEEGKSFLCGLEIYNRPTGSFEFPWDVCFVGHKSSDVDPIQGAVPLKANVHKVEDGPDYAFPLKDFTDADVWEYAEKNNVPYNSRRYDKSKGYAEFESLTYNDDHFLCCTRCMDKDAPPVVLCPKYQIFLDNISSTLHYKPVPKFVYIDN